MSSETDIYFRDAFREARAVAQQDAEGFHEILFALERFGSHLAKGILDLGQYKKQIETVAKKSPLAVEIPNKWRDYQLPFSVLYDLVRAARNDALHQGAFARHLTDHAVQLSLIIEDALMENGKLVSDYMVRGVTCASLWQPVSFARQQMLANSFSYLPLLIQRDGQSAWHLLPDRSIVKYLQGDRNQHLAKSIEEAIKDGLQVEPAQSCFVDVTVAQTLDTFNGKPLLIVGKEEPHLLIGIVTAFDLL
jgi:hypothetical protein